jgi:hypothetical protein
MEDMKKILEIIGLIFGTLGLFALINNYAISKGIHTFGWEEIIGVFVTTFKFSLSLGFILLVYWLVWQPIYKWFDRSYKKEGLKWEELSDEKKLSYSLLLFAVLAVLFGLLY